MPQILSRLSVLRPYFAMTCFLVQLNSEAQTSSFADVVLEYFDSGAGPIAGPYGGTPGGAPIPVPLEVVLGGEPGPFGVNDFLSLPMGSLVTVGFLDETIIDGVGDAVFIDEVGAAAELADIFVSSDLVNFEFLGQANGGGLTSLDLADIGFTDPVRAVRIVGLDSLGSSPGFVVANVEVLNAGPAFPEPGCTLFGAAAFGTAITRQRSKRLRTQK